MRVYYKQKFSDFVPPDMGCEQPRTEAEEITFSVMREMLYFDTRFERKNYCERYTRELESAAEAGAAMRGCCSAGSFPNNRRPFAAQPKCRLLRSASKGGTVL